MTTIAAIARLTDFCRFITYTHVGWTTERWVEKILGEVGKETVLVDNALAAQE